MIIRLAYEQDIPQLRELFMSVVIQVNKRHYSFEQVQDWALCGEDEERWNDLLQKHQVFVCELEGQIAGYCSVDSDGYIHMMFTSKDHQRMGVGRKMILYLFSYAKKLGVKSLSSNVSITARPFFERFGFKVVEEQQAKANILSLKNYKMVNMNYLSN